MAIDLLRQTRDYFKAQGIAEIDATILLEHILQCSRSEIQLKLMKLSDDELAEVNRRLRRLVLRRQTGEPVQYITGKAPFRYLEYQVGSGVLIPRPETESLVGLALEHLKGLSGASKPADGIHVADLGAGSGCVAIAIATEFKQATVTAVEKSLEAIAWLEKNVEELAPTVRIVRSDVSTACKGEKFDVVVSNPPYIPNGVALPLEVRHEPADALFGGGADGGKMPATFIQAATRLLKPGGFLALEHDQTQGELIKELLSSDYEEINSFNDLTGRPRFTTAVRI